MSIAGRLSGGDPRSLGPVVDVIDSALGDAGQLEELFCCPFAEDPLTVGQRRRAVEILERNLIPSPAPLERKIVDA